MFWWRLTIIVLFSAAVSACSSSGWSIFNAFWEMQHSRGGIISNHFMSSTSMAEIRRMSSAHCSSVGRPLTNVNYLKKHGEFTHYEVQCKSSAELERANALLEYTLREKCLSFGYLAESPRFKECISNQKALQDIKTANENQVRVAEERETMKAHAQKSNNLMNLGLQMLNQGTAVHQAPSFSSPKTVTTCFKEREWVSGFNRNCVYDCLGSETVETIASTAICPLNIKR